MTSPSPRKGNAGNFAQGGAEMNIYLLKRTDDVDYDETAGFVIRARSLPEAQALAKAKDYSNCLWSSPTVEATVIGTSHSEVAEIILRDYRAG
jgi:hypothetical protein